MNSAINETEKQGVMLTIELKLYGGIAEAYIKAAKQRSVDEAIVVAKIIEIVAENKGMIDAILEKP